MLGAARYREGDRNMSTRRHALLIVLFVLSIGVNALIGRLGGVGAIKR